MLKTHNQNSVIVVIRWKQSFKWTYGQSGNDH